MSILVGLWLYAFVTRFPIALEAQL